MMVNMFRNPHFQFLLKPFWTQFEEGGGMSECTWQNVDWIKMVPTEMGIRTPSPMTIWCDNMAASALAENPTHHIKSKHVPMNYHFIRERIVVKSLEGKFIGSKDQRVD